MMLGSSSDTQGVCGLQVTSEYLENLTTNKKDALGCWAGAEIARMILARNSWTAELTAKLGEEVEALIKILLGNEELGDIAKNYCNAMIQQPLNVDKLAYLVKNAIAFHSMYHGDPASCLAKWKSFSSEAQDSVLRNDFSRLIKIIDLNAEAVKHYEKVFAGEKVPDLRKHMNLINPLDGEACDANKHAWGMFEDAGRSPLAGED